MCFIILNNLYTAHHNSLGIMSSDQNPFFFLTVDNLRKLLKAELKIVAQTLNVDVTACTRKAEILDAIVTHEGLTQQAAAAALNDTNTAQNESNPMSEINVEKARVELQERKDRLKANEHERERWRNTRKRWRNTRKRWRNTRKRWREKG